MNSIEDKSELESILDSALCLAVRNVRTIADRQNNDMSSTEVDKLHHLMEIIYYAKVTKSHLTIKG